MRKLVQILVLASVIILALVAASAQAATLSYDPTLSNSCVLLYDQATETESWLPSNCSITLGNSVALVDGDAWTSTTWHATASSLDCNTYYVSYVAGASPFMYGEMKDCSVDTTYRNISHKQSTRHSVVGIPSGMYLVDANHPNGYTLSATVALTDPAPAGFLRVALVWHLRSSLGTNVFVEFDAYDNATTRKCTDANGDWTAYCPSGSGTSTVFEHYRYWSGTNIALATWVPLSVGSAAVVDTLAEYRSDLDPEDLEIIQVYTTIEAKAAWGILQTKALALAD